MGGVSTNEVYFNAAERDRDNAWTTIIHPVLHRHAVDFRHVLDLGAGHGRFEVRFAELADQITIVDSDPDCVQFCRERFAQDARFVYICNDGCTLRHVRDKSISLFFTFDSMIMFDFEVIQSYTKEAFRVLAPGAQGFFHYSNYDRVPGGDFRSNPHSRNFMSKSLFEHLALTAGFAIVYSTSIPWGGVPDLDAIALLRKPLTA